MTIEDKNISEKRKVLFKAEIKRVGERLMKKELCAIYGFNYNYYMNCISDRNQPSEKMVEKLTEYLNTPTNEIYHKVFAKRERETEFHEEIKVSDDEVNSLLTQLSDKGVFKEPLM